MRIELPTPESIQEAATHLREGNLVVMPTETVYGLAANALKAEAVQKIFKAKGRPSDNPLIVHLASIESISEVAEEPNATALQLAEAFWPGPLTLVLPKKPHVPDVTTGTLDTVAVRMPSHQVARALIAVAGIPLAAPSANLFMQLSPTRAEDIDPELAKWAALILDGGACEFGLESTVVDCTEPTPRLLRPGGISRAQIETLLGMKIESGSSQARRSPGQYPRHYAPRTPVTLVKRLEPEQAGLTFQTPVNPNQRQMPEDPANYAAQLYHALHDLDEKGLERIFVQDPPEIPDWEAVWDRLRKASTT